MNEEFHHHTLAIMEEPHQGTLAVMDKLHQFTLDIVTFAFFTICCISSKQYLIPKSNFTFSRLGFTVSTLKYFEKVAFPTFTFVQIQNEYKSKCIPHFSFSLFTFHFCSEYQRNTKGSALFNFHSHFSHSVLGIEKKYKGKSVGFMKSSSKYKRNTKGIP